MTRAGVLQFARQLARCWPSTSAFHQEAGSVASRLDNLPSLDLRYPAPFAFSKSWLSVGAGARFPEGQAQDSSPDGEEHQHADDGPTIAVDRSGLSHAPVHSHGPITSKEPETPLTKHLKSLIKFRGGPISVAEYMEEVLTHPGKGFYMTRDVFGTAGDFVTSPEVSQMFGELVGIWAVCLWEKMGKPSAVNLIELGPGRGTLMADLLRGTRQFTPFAQSLSVHMVECSPKLREIQHKNLHVAPPGEDRPMPSGSISSDVPGASRSSTPAEHQLSGISGISGAPVAWHGTLSEVPEGVPSIVVAHEFYDALPVHQFQRTEKGWCERLVDVDNDETSPRHLRLVLSPGCTLTGSALLRLRLGWEAPEVREKLESLEVSPKALGLTRELAARVAKDGGAALIVDYGENGVIPDSLQGIRQHKFVNILDQPGTADLSAYVDFASIRHMAGQEKEGAATFGPITQSEFLKRLGIYARLEALLQNATRKQAEALKIGYWRLIGDGEFPSDNEHGDNKSEKATLPPGMGNRYKAMVIASSRLGTPVGFE